MGVPGRCPPCRSAEISIFGLLVLQSSAQTRAVAREKVSRPGTPCSIAVALEETIDLVDTSAMRRWKNPMSGVAHTSGTEGASTTRSHGRPVLLVIAAVFLFGSGGIGWLAIRAGAQQDLMSLANNVQVDAQQENVIEWKVFAARSVSPSLQQAHGAIERDILEQANRLAPGGPVKDITSLFESYDRDVEAEFVALSSRQLAQAQLIHSRAEASFDRLATAIDEARIYYESAAIER
ncbi:MAG: hypothetical protein M3O29_02330 [Actinomycetota bacterium]|nr:hypothetical protein [Actinomycetota bacterium]